MPRSAPIEALVWRRGDLFESSRIVTLLTRERGKVRAFAKGAHRQDSLLLGRVDFLNLLRVELWQRGATMPLLSRADLLHEPRELRDPTRYLLADHLVQLVDAALPDDRADPALCDLMQGGLVLLERCPMGALATVLCGLEWRFLLALGLQPEVDACADTGTPLSPRKSATLAPSGRGFIACNSHDAGTVVQASTRDALRQLGGTPGRSWPTLALPGPVLDATLMVLGRLVAAAIERPPNARAAAVRAVRREASRA